MLVLFDIDGTLLLSHGEGARAMQEAGRQVVGPDFSLRGVEFAGRLDPLIFQDGLARAGRDGFERHHGAFRRAYAESLARRLAAPASAQPLPGVQALLARLAARADVALGLVTGNYPETGALKLRAAGIDPALFRVPVWGDEGPTRRDLPQKAMERHVAATGRPIEPWRVVVVGDTVHDVDCAHHNGCLALAVGTGPAHGLEALRAREPELLLEDLADTDLVMAWLDRVARGEIRRGQAPQTP